MQEVQAQNMLANNLESEKEMEKLRVELLDATKAARELFDVTVKNDKVGMSVTQMQCEIAELNGVSYNHRNFG